MTIYGIYTQNGHRAGFWVQHRTWNNICAHVLGIAGKDCGVVPGTATTREQAPVQARIFDVRSGRPLPPHLGDFPPHSSAYYRIAEPPWFRPAPRYPSGKQPRPLQRMAR